MANKVLLTFILADLLFLASGGVLIGFALTSEAQQNSSPTAANVARNLILVACPFKGNQPMQSGQAYVYTY